MIIPCDLCGKPTDDSLMQIVEEGGSIQYACPDCFLASQEEPPEGQA